MKPKQRGSMEEEEARKPNYTWGKAKSLVCLKYILYTEKAGEKTALQELTQG